MDSQPAETGRLRRREKQLTGRLRPADPFDLIRWLARSQSDPRKAIAEFVQNSLDAAATEIHVIRGRQARGSYLRVLDNGSGVLPMMSRREALEYLATHIGQSLKQKLSVRQRHELMVQGKYGIGLLGFWSVSERFEIVTQVADSEVWRLVLSEDQPTWRIEPAERRLDRSGTWTEVVLHPLHRAALGALSGRRISDYLATELRGQLLHRPVRIEVTDKLGPRALRHIRVEPRRFKGEMLEALPLLEVPGYSAATVELYLLAPGDRSGRVSLASQGTIVADDMASLESFGLARPPWNNGQLSGVIDFPDFEVAPGARRGVVPNQAALAFFTALDAFEVPLLRRVESEQQRRAANLESNLVKELGRVLLRMPEALPQYDFFPILTKNDLPLPGDAPPARGPAEEPKLPRGIESELGELFPPGPLETLRIQPSRATVVRGTDKHLAAQALDNRGRRLDRDVLIRWQCDSPLGELEDRGDGRAVFHAGGDEGKVTIEATAISAERTASASCKLEIVQSRLQAPGDRGIPQPDLVEAAAEEWRSRVLNDRWQINSGHPDFLATSASARLRLRYLLSLLAKEVVLRSFGQPLDGPLLEKLVEVLAFSERQMER
jgi:hypothetical protein